MTHRPIKFRAFDPTRQEMFYNVIVGGHFVCVEYVNTQDEFEADYYAADNRDCGQPFIVMQFTGWTDAVGCDIYSGDLFKQDDVIYEIQFNPETASFDVFNTESEETEALYDWRKDRMTATFTIIGNIHETELTK